MRRNTVVVLLAYGALAAAVLACLWLIQLAPLRLGWGRELVGAGIAIVAMGVGLYLARGTRASPGSSPAAGGQSDDADPSEVARGRNAQPIQTDPTPQVALSQREHDVLRHLAQGLSNKQLARALSVSENTVKTHLANLYAKLGASRRTEALAAARRAGLLP